MTTETQITHYACKPGIGLAQVWWLGGRVAIKAGSEQTSGRFSQLEFDDPRGTAPPLHIHHGEDETFYVVSGSVTVLVGDERIEADAGDFVFAPRGTPHAYVVTSERARMLVTFSPGGVEEFFAEAGMPDDGSGVPPAVQPPPDPDELARAVGRYGVEIVGPPPTLADLGL
jgi:quercetin dioxygenase-like cupin family protein